VVNDLDQDLDMIKIISDNFILLKEEFSFAKHNLEARGKKQEARGEK